MFGSSPSSLRLEEFSRFNQELEALVRTRLPLSQGLRRMARDLGSSRVLGALADEVAKGLERGRSLSESLEESGRSFPRLYIQLVRVGEKSESLATVLSAIVRSARREQEMRSSLKTMLIYPTFILTLAMAITVGVALFVVPHFVNLYAEIGAELPAITLFIIAGSRSLSGKEGLGLLLIPILLVMLYRIARKRPSTRRWLDAVVYRLPLFGSLVSVHHAGLWCRALGELVGGGIPLDESLDCVAEAVSNLRLRKITLDAAARVRRGGRIFDATEGVYVLPASFLWMIGRAEERGDLSDTLRELADLAEAKTTLLRQRAFTFFEPILLLCIGLGIGILVVSLYLPLFWIGHVVGL